MKFKKDDEVKVINQEIYGRVLRVHTDTNEVVIKDHDSEYNSPDNELIYRPKEIINID